MFTLKKTIISFAILFVTIGVTAQKGFEVVSPNAKLRVNILIDKAITYSVSYDNDIVLYPSNVALETNKGTFGTNPKVSKTEKKSVNKTITAPFYKRETIVDNYNELT